VNDSLVLLWLLLVMLVWLDCMLVKVDGSVVESDFIIGMMICLFLVI